MRIFILILKGETNAHLLRVRAETGTQGDIPEPTLPNFLAMLLSKSPTIRSKNGSFHG